MLPPYGALDLLGLVRDFGRISWANDLYGEALSARDNLGLREPRAGAEPAYALAVLPWARTEVVQILEVLMALQDPASGMSAEELRRDLEGLGSAIGEVVPPLGRVLRVAWSSPGQELAALESASRTALALLEGHPVWLAALSAEYAGQVRNGTLQFNAADYEAVADKRRTTGSLTFTEALPALAWRRFVGTANPALTRALSVYLAEGIVTPHSEARQVLLDSLQSDNRHPSAPLDDLSLTLLNRYAASPPAGYTGSRGSRVRKGKPGEATRRKLVTTVADLLDYLQAVSKTPSARRSPGDPARLKAQAQRIRHARVAAVSQGVNLLAGDHAPPPELALTAAVRLSLTEPSAGRDPFGSRVQRLLVDMMDDARLPKAHTKMRRALDDGSSLQLALRVWMDEASVEVLEAQPSAPTTRRVTRRGDLLQNPALDPPKRPRSAGR